jgi:hypothetical protein
MALFTNEWQLRYFQDNNPKVVVSDTPFVIERPT